ncbi:MAG TPA: PAS domain-containing protein [Ktedonobacteraceae bacterium]
MQNEQVSQLEYILDTLTVGAAIIDTSVLRILYVNAYLHELLGEPWRSQDITNSHLEDILPREVYLAAQPVFERAISTHAPIYFDEVPYEGFLEERGRTHWRLVIRPIQIESTQSPALIITVEDVTEAVRSRLHLNAIHHISSAIADDSALSLVLNRILQALQDMVGSRRCAIFFMNNSHPGVEARIPGYVPRNQATTDTLRTATLMAHKNIHLRSQSWHPPINDQTLPGRAVKERRPTIITDTSTTPEIVLPYLDLDGKAIRPGSVLCVPIFDPYPPSALSSSDEGGDVLGTIEVYHRRNRGFPDEEIRLLERFARQAGLAIQNARLFRGIESWAQVASRNARQKEKIMQSIPDGVVLYDTKWQVADINVAARKLFGWSDDVLGLPITQAMAHSTADLRYFDFLRWPDPIAEIAHRALTRQVNVFKLIGADGNTYTVRCSYVPIRDDDGNVFAFVAVYQDVTRETAARERIEAEVVTRTTELAQRNAALQLANEAQAIMRSRIELLLERLPSGVILVNAQDHTIALVNHKAAQILQKIGAPLEYCSDPEETAKRLLGKHYNPALREITLYQPDGELVPYNKQPFYLAISQGKASEAELHTAEIDGQIFYFLFNAAPLFSPDGLVSGVVLVMHEITTTKTLERTREDFFTIMAHELKTPLANIRAHLSALLAHDLQWSMEEQMSFLRTADEQVERIVRMINQFLDASRVEARALRLQWEPILLPELVEDLQERLEALITNSKCRLVIEMPADIPAVDGDYELLISVLTNLLNNAFRYTPEGDAVILKAEPMITETGITSITVSVIDHGPGISQEQQKTLFTRFSTFAAQRRPDRERPGQPLIEYGRDSRRWSAATGLGLYISRGILEAHDSKLAVKSQPGQGAAFMFTLPVAGKTASSKAPPPPEDEP